MTLNIILQKLNKGQTVELLSDKPDSIENLRLPDFYIPPTFRAITEAKLPNFMLFSATGATGKSALARYIAANYNGLYWNLAKITLGENSFHGTIMKAIGFDNVSNFLANLRNGNSLLVIDAFDEADMISGRLALEFLLSDLIKIVKGATNCSIILFARTETSLFISEYLNKNKAFFCHYEIGYFNEFYAKEFIKEKLKLKGINVTPVVVQCIEQQFVQIRKIVNDETLLESFIGYAPVLEALAEAYDEERNTVKLFNSILAGTTNSQIIYDILTNLIKREQDKVCDSLKERWSKKYPEFNKWSTVYNIKEQFLYLLSYVLFDDIDFALLNNDTIPSFMFDDYCTAIRGFISQHPFLQRVIKDNASSCAEFTGPAFRDYALAFILSHDDLEDLAVDYFSNHQVPSHCPSPLLFDFYSTFTNDNFKSNLLSYMYESFKARETLDSICEINIDGYDNKAVALYRIINISTHDISFEYEINIDVKGNCYYFRNLSNTNININSNICIGDQNSNSRIYNSSIICNQITWNTSSVILEGRKPGYTLIVSKEPFKTSDGSYTKFTVKIDDEDCLKISSPNIKSNYSLRSYSYSYENDDVVDIIKFTHAIRKIMGCLRKHSKDVPARDKEFIDNVIVGSSEFCKSVLDFLISSNILYIDPNESHLYKLSIDNSSQYGISWGQLSYGSNIMLDNTFQKYKSSYSKHDLNR